MRLRSRRCLTAGLLAAVLVAPAAPGSAAPGTAAPAQAVRTPLREEPGNGPERNARAATLPPQAASAASASTERRSTTRGYPRQTVLPTVPVDPDDASLKLGLVPYHDLAPRLNALQDRSRRVSVEVIGESHLGRALYLVTVTAPESAAEARRQEALRRRIEEDPRGAARDETIARDYKVPHFVNGNIHGNEWEGTDASLRVITELATSRDPAVARLLARTRLYFNLTMNPDGRVAGTRANAAGFNLNRDFVTASQPETRAVRDALISTQPLVLLDLHGYVNGTLIEPTTPPHGRNYEYDLFIRNAYRNGLAMEAAVKALGYTPDDDGVLPPVIPFRDWDEGWDDWPPIFTPQYAAYHGAVAAHTIEIPLQVNGSAYDTLPAAELRRRSRINADVAAATVRASIAYLDRHRRALVADSIEMFRRGEAGEAQHPVRPGDVDGLIGPEDVYTTTFPRAYVVPVGGRQRSAPAAARLVDHLVANDVEVLRAREEFRLDGRTYPAGSYVVDMHQAKRGMANVMLEAGGDVSDRVDAMYDISGWSHRLLWGATVDVVESGGLAVPGRPVVAADPTGSVPGRGALALRLTDPKDLQALNALLDADVPVRWTGRGDVTVPASARRLAERLADRHGVTFRRASAASGRPLDDVVVAAAAAYDELWALQEMGFEVRPVSNEVLDAGFSWRGVDVLLVSSGLSYADLGARARASLGRFLARGGGVVTRGGTGAAFNAEAGLLDVTAVEGRGDANGIVNVTNSGGPLTSRALPHSFVYSPLWFTGLGAGVTVDQRYDADDVLVAGHWRDAEDGTGGQDDAAGQAAVVHGVDETGAPVVLFGTEPLFRAHPKGLYAQVGRALHWSAVTASASAEVAAAPAPRP